MQSYMNDISDRLMQPERTDTLAILNNQFARDRHYLAALAYEMNTFVPGIGQ